jgi:three-Cys-motif partner protein
MPKPQWGSAHTVEKLKVIEKHLHVYTSALRNKNFKLMYIDAFAGSGEIELVRDMGFLADVEELDPIVEGSVRRALKIRHPFHEYHFVDKSASKVVKLDQLRLDFPALSSRIYTSKDDANSFMMSLCSKTDWKHTRAVVFLDPFGNQIEWSTLERIAATKAIDLWYLFPAGLGVNRQISRRGIVLPEHEEAVNRMLGRTDWQETFIRIVESDQRSFNFLEPKAHRIKQASIDDITRYVIQLMKTIFQGVVLDSWLPLGRNGSHWYSLIFACANPDPAAVKLATKLANAVMSRK